jgi:hypothetical protein
VRVTLNEARPVAEALKVTEGPGRFLVRLITPGWGSSGYYSQAVLEQAARDRIWPAGTHMYIDHPTESEEWERPERTLRDLAAVLMEDARWDASEGGLVAEAVVFSEWRRPLGEMLEHIGTSIRGYAEAEDGEAEGRKGKVFTRLTEGVSVDFVTHAGRGGKVLAILESARPRPVAEATANDRREQLSTLVRDAYAAENTWVWVRDFDDAERVVWFEIETREDAGIYAQGYEVVDDVATDLIGPRTEVRVQTTYVPVDAAPAAADEAASLPTSPAGQSTATESQEDTMATTQIEESRLAQLETDAGRATALESERAAAIERAEKAEAKLAAVETRAKLRPVVSQVIDASETMPAAMKARVINATVEALGADATEDTAKAAAEAARTAGETEAAEIAEAFGVGTPRGLGGTTTPTGDGKGISESEFADVLGLNIKEA